MNAVLQEEKPSKIGCNVDFQADGVQHGHLTIPYSRNESPWGSLLMPISVFKNGAGPTVLFTGGNHGDEYEGPVALMKLIRSLDVSRIRGRVIVIPALNYPAVKAGTRLSPIDGRNMNRVFPGKRDGSITEMIADYVYRYLLPLADVVVDIHSGGKVMTFAPTSVIHRLPERTLMAKTVAGARAFGAPYALVLEELDAAGMLDTAVEEAGKVFISTELGGAGTTTVRTVAIAERGVHNVLVHFGVLEAEPLPAEQSRFLETPDGAFVVAPQSGIYEIAAEPGSTIRAGEPVGYIHDIDDPTRPALVCCARIDGLVIHRHVAGLVNRGDCLAVVAVDCEVG
ncbi:MAG TPA: N(2)-acetyl-L-2,4-diaminobutanoate deacetylase DoeB [Candidatus Competibacteraceae bacterium]|nr:N(2)-acetyl-L-2,4-diaminobutanoate deacetylase DoeB [Candidatus Competibacteraceae bacterium]